MPDDTWYRLQLSTEDGEKRWEGGEGGRRLVAIGVAVWAAGAHLGGRVWRGALLQQQQSHLLVVVMGRHVEGREAVL